MTQQPSGHAQSPDLSLGRAELGKGRPRVGFVTWRLWSIVWDSIPEEQSEGLRYAGVWVPYLLLEPTSGLVADLESTPQ